MPQQLWAKNASVCVCAAIAATNQSARPRSRPNPSIENRNEGAP